MEWIITNINYPDNTFDAIVCSHVLEHVVDHLKALKELYRVLKFGGWAIILVPIKGKSTYEDPLANTPELRKKIYGNPGHVRQYGEDFKLLLESVGFKVLIFSKKDFLNDSLSKRMCVERSQDIWLSLK